MTCPVQLNDLVLTRQNRVILDGLTLELHERRVGVVGRNGSGKSTLARTLCGLIAPDRGSVTVNGVDVLADRRAALRSVGIIFQNPDHQIIFPTVEEEVMFGLRQLGLAKPDARDRAHAALDRFGCVDWAPRIVSSLSQGQKHLVCLVAVLAMEPALIVLDEPFAGLDIPTTRRLHRVLDGLEQSIIHITHDIAALAGYDRVLWVDAGRIAADGAPEPVLSTYVERMEAEGAADDFADPSA